MSEVKLSRLSHAVETFGIKSDVKVHVLYLGLIDYRLILSRHVFTWWSRSGCVDELPSVVRAGIFMGRHVKVRHGRFLLLREFRDKSSLSCSWI